MRLVRGKTQPVRWKALINGNRLEDRARFLGIFGGEIYADHPARYSETRGEKSVTALTRRHLRGGQGG